MANSNIERLIAMLQLFGVSKEQFYGMTVEERNAVFEAIREHQIAEIKRQRAEEQRLEQERLEEEKRLEEERLMSEHIDEVTSMDLSLDHFNIFDTDERSQSVFCDSISDALIISLSEIGSVDIEYIAKITGSTYKAVIHTLKGAIYQNPETWDECFYKGWETAEEYLSGNLKRKWEIAYEANKKYKGYFDDNLVAIEKVLPPTVASKDIYVTLGSPWIPADIIDEFIEHLLGPVISLSRKAVSVLKDENYKTIHDETGAWEIPMKSRYMHNVATTRKWGTPRMEALNIIENSLNMKSVVVRDEITGSDLKIKRVINKPDTIAAMEKQRLILDEFQRWIWTDPERKERLETIFDRDFGCVRRRVFDGSFLHFPQMSEEIELYPYQRNAIARIIFTPNTLLAHDVGSGKTYVMIAAGMEMKRLGLSKKNMYVVPNDIVGQWREAFAKMYPNSKVLVIDPKSFGPRARKTVLERVRDEDFDAIIIAYSCFDRISLSREYYIEELRNRKNRLAKIVEEQKTSSHLKSELKRVAKELSELVIKEKEVSDYCFFDELGITRLFVDEAHNFKNVPLDTRTRDIYGISNAGSKKCKNMFDKVRFIQQGNINQGGVVFATGTPITNSITDAFIMQLYLQPFALDFLKISTFDAWIGMFAERVSEFEIDVDTSSYRLVTRFSKFHNIPELTSLLATIADFHQIDESEVDIPKVDGYVDVMVSKAPEFDRFLSRISERADIVRSGGVKREEDNMLKITTDGRKAALDLRLVLPNEAYSHDSKVAKCALNVSKVYFDTKDKSCTQIVFCDISTPKDTFNIYDELKLRLVELGIPSDQIAFIHDADTEEKRTALFKQLRKGKIRIIVGSTMKLGLGVNIQDKLIAIHHLDVPWRPSDMTQREGRILRQGNSNPYVYIYRYITEGSFDAYSWQLLETKQRFITGILSDSITSREGAEIENTVLNYAEVKALAIGNPLVKERVETANELTRYKCLLKQHVESRIQMEKELMEIPGKISYQKRLIEKCKADISSYEQWKANNPEPLTAKDKREDGEARKKVRECLDNELRNHIISREEKVLMEYRGFQIILPSNMISEKPYVWVVGSGKYAVEMGDNEIGNLVRIDNFIDGLTSHLEKLEKRLYDLEERTTSLELEISKEFPFDDKIEDFKAKLEEIDKQLGVNKDE